MKRIVHVEWLDTLAHDDSRAIRSRRDLGRVNAWMRSHRIMARALQMAGHGRQPMEIVDMGAGDGDFLLRVARLALRNGAGGLRSPASGAGHIGNPWQSARAILLDSKATVAAETMAGFAALGWRAESVVCEAFEWTRTAQAGSADCIISNLFLHHLTEAQLAELFGALARQARWFVALEPRRGLWPLLCSHLLWAIGCNAVTQYDAVASVQAGFTRRELSDLWPSGSGWRLTERSAGLFNHLFEAKRTE